MPKRFQNKWCFVPYCTSTSKSCPGKEFLAVPSNTIVRSQWFKASRRDMKESPLSLKTHLYCCEDHFDLENDLENFMRLKFYRKEGLTTLVKLKPGVIPHRFSCQDGKNSTGDSPHSRIDWKPQRKKLIRDFLGEANQASCSSLESHSGIVEDEVVEQIIEPINVDYCKFKHVIVQVNLKPKFRSKASQIKSEPRDGCTSSVSPAVLRDSGTQMASMKWRRLRYSSNSSKSTFSCDDASDCVLNTGNSNRKAHHRVKTQRKKCLDLIEWRPALYSGLNEQFHSLVTSLSSSAGFTMRDLLLMFRKLTLNEPFICLGSYFDLSPSQARRIFSRNIHRLASEMLTLIYWPDRSSVQRIFPRNKYNRLLSIVGGFEVNIEEPLNLTVQCATWSQYKQANTIKYLVSCSPSGYISFISRGYGGGTSETALTQQSGYLDHLKPGMLVVADGSFKNLASLLCRKGVNLVEPASLSSDQLHRNELKTTRIPGLGVYVKKVIDRIRTFQFVSPSVCLDTKSVPLLDAAVIVIAGLVNLMDPLSL